MLSELPPSTGYEVVDVSRTLLTGSWLFCNKPDMAGLAIVVVSLVYVQRIAEIQSSSPDGIIIMYII